MSRLIFTNCDELVKSHKIKNFRRPCKKLQRQGAQIPRNETYLSYVAVTKDAAQRSIWTFYGGGNRGIGMIEVVIAIFLVTVGVLAILSMQPSAWRAVGKSDYLGRGAGILHRELEWREAWIMNPCNIVPTGNRPQQTIIVSGLAATVAGDATYTVDTSITAVAGSTNAWTIAVVVTWPNQLAGGYRNLTESMVVTRQENFRSPVSCTDSTTAVPAGF